MLTYVTTILSAPPSFDLIDLADIKLELGLTNTNLDVWLETKISNMSAAVEKYCSRRFVLETIQDEIFFQEAFFRGTIRAGARPLQLTHWPIVSVASVVVQGDNATYDVPPDHYVVNSQRGELIRARTSTQRQREWHPGTTTVQYVAGFSSVPLPVAEATLKMVTKAYWKRGKDPTLKSSEQPSGKEEYWISSRSEGDMTPDIQDLLDDYRVPVIA
jgi:hypothetical protein